MRLGGVGPGGRERLHYPDLLLIDPGGRRIAIELELSSKGRGRREKILAGYAADARVDVVLYLVRDGRIGRSIQKSARRLGIGPLVHVQRVELRRRRAAGGGGRGIDRDAGGGGRAGERRPPYWTVVALVALLAVPVAWLPAAAVGVALAVTASEPVGRSPRGGGLGRRAPPRATIALGTDSRDARSRSPSASSPHTG